MAIYGHNLRSETFELTRKTETDCALDENSKDLLEHDVHVTCDPKLIDQVFQENTSKKHPSMLRPIKQITQGKEKQYCIRV